MKRPDPRVGQIVLYDFLWNEQHQAGLTRGIKDRPCVVAGITKGDDGRVTTVNLVPITHETPSPGQRGFALPPQTQPMTGLDDKKSWVNCSEINQERWEKIGPAKPGQFLYGHLPRGLTKKAIDHVREAEQAKQLATVDRAAAPTQAERREAQFEAFKRRLAAEKKAGKDRVTTIKPDKGIER